ncbi:hypothetical protein D3C78_1198360 [compost metagenome]
MCWTCCLSKNMKERAMMERFSAWLTVMAANAVMNRSTVLSSSFMISHKAIRGLSIGCARQQKPFK